MTRDDLVRKVLAVAEGMGYSLDVWAIGHGLWGATAGDRLQYTPRAWVMSLNRLALEVLDAELCRERDRQQMRDRDPELSRVTPQIATDLTHRPDCGEGA